VRLAASFAAALAVAGAAGAASAPATTIVATVANGRVTVTDAGGKPLRRLTAGRYRIVVRDRSAVDDVHVSGSRVDRRTGRAFRGSTVWLVVFHTGWDYRFFSDSRPVAAVTLRAEFCACHL
jgi:hypothetical protein